MDLKTMAIPESITVRGVTRAPAPLAKPPPEASSAIAFAVKNLSIWYGEKQAIRNVSIDIPAKAITAIIGPSGCGKSTFLRCLNRMHELVPRTRVEGEIRFYGDDLYGPGVDPAVVRRRVGMVF